MDTPRQVEGEQAWSYTGQETLRLLSIDEKCKLAFQPCVCFVLCCAILCYSPTFIKPKYPYCSRVRVIANQGSAYIGRMAYSHFYLFRAHFHPFKAFFPLDSPPFPFCFYINAKVRKSSAYLTHMISWFYQLNFRSKAFFGEGKWLGQTNESPSLPL